MLRRPMARSADAPPCRSWCRPGGPSSPSCWPAARNACASCAYRTCAASSLSPTPASSSFSTSPMKL
eukprot:828787-Pyramimonas_sp.AAC.1